MNKAINSADQNLAAAFFFLPRNVTNPTEAGIYTNYTVDILTPPNQSEAPQVFRVGQEGHEDETMQVQALHQDPVVVCSQEIYEQQDGHFTTHLKNKCVAKKVNTLLKHISYQNTYQKYIYCIYKTGVHIPTK